MIGAVGVGRCSWLLVVVWCCRLLLCGGWLFSLFHVFVGLVAGCCCCVVVALVVCRCCCRLFVCQLLPV